MIWSHVTGAVAGSRPAAFATDLRYQSSCVFAQNGTVTSLPSHCRPRQRAGDDVLRHPLRDVVRHGCQEPGLGHLGDERRVQAHDVDRRVLGGQSSGELLALGAGVARQDRHLERVLAVRGLRALLGDLGLAAVVRVDVPGEHRCSGPGPCACCQRSDEPHPHTRASARERRRTEHLRTEASTPHTPRATPVRPMRATGSAVSRTMNCPPGQRPDLRRWRRASSHHPRRSLVRAARRERALRPRRDDPPVARASTTAPSSASPSTRSR